MSERILVRGGIRERQNVGRTQFFDANAVDVIEVPATTDVSLDEFGITLESARGVRWLIPWWRVVEYTYEVP